MYIAIGYLWNKKISMTSIKVFANEQSNSTINDGVCYPMSIMLESRRENQAILKRVFKQFAKVARRNGYVYYYIGCFYKEFVPYCKKLEKNGFCISWEIVEKMTDRILLKEL